MVRACKTALPIESPRPVTERTEFRMKSPVSGARTKGVKGVAVKVVSVTEVGGKHAGGKDAAAVDRARRRQATRLRAERLLRTEIGYLYHRSFDHVNADKKILREPAEGSESSRTRRAPTGADAYLARLYEVPLLSQEQETHLFRKMNYLKFRADRLRRKLNPRTATIAQLEAIECLQAEAQVVRNQIIEANLRLVFSLAKRYANVGTAAFDEFMGEGHITLMRAVEKFDFSRGVKFSTYATWAVVNGCNALLKKQSPTNRQSFWQPAEGVEDTVPDHRVTACEEQSVQELRHAVGKLLLGLNTRERAIIEARFGFDLNQSPTLKELGEGLGISKERVRQLQQRALDKLRALAEHHKVELPDN